MAYHEVECKSPMNVCTKSQDFKYMCILPQLPKQSNGMAPNPSGEKF